MQQGSIPRKPAPMIALGPECWAAFRMWRDTANGLTPEVRIGSSNRLIRGEGIENSARGLREMRLGIKCGVWMSGGRSKQVGPESHHGRTGERTSGVINIFKRVGIVH
jgi:hypothetical protein